MSRRKGNSSAGLHRQVHMATLAVAVGLALSTNAMAQESGNKWKISDPAQPTEYGTQQEAVAGMSTLPAPFPGIWETANKIKDRQVDANGNITLTYWMGKEQPNDPDWSYYPNANLGSPTVTEQDAYDLILAEIEAVNPVCPGATLTQTVDWEPLIPGYEGRFEQKKFLGTYMRGDNTPDFPCVTEEYGEQLIVRKRRTECPNQFAEWKDEYAACVNTDFVAKITGKGEECDAQAGPGGGKTSGLVGNPCNVKTGEKFETESDIELGWISLARYYHSGVANETGGFGPGWTHSHGIKLAITGSSIALIDGSGYQLRFRQDGSNYWATNSSGERLVANGSQWVLYRASSVMTFDSKGLLVSRQDEDGTSLTYAYNSIGRLDSITHSTGRALTFHYNGEAADDTIASVSSAGITLASYGYAAPGQVSSVTYPDSGTRTYHYEDTRYPLHLTGITAEDNVRFSTFAYDTKGRVTSSQHAGGADGVTLAYTTQGGSVVTDALGHQTNYGLTAAPTGDGVPRKVGDIVDSRGTFKQSYYDETTDFRRRLSLVEDRRGTKTQHTYAEATDAVTGQPARTHSVQEALGLAQARTTQERHDIASNRLIFTKLGNRETRITRNARLQPLTVSVKDTATSETRTTTYAYCEAADVSAPSSTCPTLGLVKSVDGPRSDVSDVVTLSYYGSDDPVCGTTPSACSHRKGDLWKVTDALGRSVETLGYDALGRPLSRLDINGVATDASYHIRGWQLSSKVRGPNNASEADDQVNVFEYWPTGLVKKVTLPDGSFTNYVYDAAQRLTDVSDSTGASIHYTLDNAGNRLVEDSKTSGGTVKRTLSRVYNTLGQLEADKDAALHAINYGYDAEDNVSSVTDPLLRQTTRQHDPLNRLSATLQDVGGIEATTALAYNEFDQVTKVTDPKLLETLYTYNAFGDRTQLTSPDTGITAYTFDAASNLKTTTDARGVARQYNYDALNRLTAVVHPDTSLNVAFTYDTAPGVCPSGEQFALGRRATMTDGSGSTAYCYDRFGHLVRKVQTTNGVGLTVKYAYNLAGQLTALTYPDGSVADYTRDAQGRVATMGVTPPSGARELLLTVTGYNPFGPEQGWTYGNGRTLTRAYDLNYAVQSLRDTASGGLDLGFARDELLQITAIHNATFATPARVKFGYDALSRLTQFRDGPSNTVLESYDYDKTGNREAFTNSGGLQDYVYASTNHKLSSVAGVARGYDAAGNTTAIGGTAKELVYGDHGRMTQVKQLGVPVMNYAYNGVGERVRRYAGSSETYTVFDESGHWLGDYGPGGAAVQQAIWLGDQPVGLQVGPSTAIGRLHYVQPDHVGTPRSVIDPVRNVAVWTWDLAGEAFGNSVPNQDPDLDASPFVLNMRFAGQLFDSATGLNYNYYRDYEAVTGRYLQGDPIGQEGGMGLYHYVDNSPLLNVDVLGLSKGQKRNLSVGSLNKKSSKESVKAALDAARRDGASKAHINNLRALLKVIRRGGTMSEGGLPLLMLNRLWREQCEAGDDNACSFYCEYNECVVAPEPMASVRVFRMSYVSDFDESKETDDKGEVCR
ncbi:RHS repeat-associated core domain-containing protein [Lysobacter capsici]|uniref:RHS repeat-associated core domain-containing protein n=1 Tax=Lysobacter capsici TaxID=435897 RepID=UPI000BBA8161|nr:RHS repeat-associated core domain-containing protein [Lysobacter capsici]ATE70800.1 type IV secretion protein Rhs [Lysobacter capsici]